MIWIIRLFLLLYAVLYFGLGAWAIIDPVKDALELNNIPSFMDAVGLKVSAEIGYSEVAGVYGGINVLVGLLCLVGIFSKYVAKKVLSLLAFLTFAIAFGRYLLSLIPTAPGFLNTFFIFEVVTFLICIVFLFGVCYLFSGYLLLFFLSFTGFPVSDIILLFLLLFIFWFVLFSL